MTTKQKTLVRDLFDGEATRWADWAYDPDESYDIYPTGRARLAIIRRELDRLLPTRKLRMLDAGCGSGDIALALEKDGHEIHGLDFAPAMIAQCRERYRQTFPERDDADRRFVIGDVESFALEPEFDAAYAVGLLEYLEQDQAFFKMMRVHLRKKGVLLIECRNRLFNAVSGNRYTLDESQRGELAALITELEDIGRLSPRPDSEIPEILASTFSSIKPFDADRAIPRDAGIQFPAGIQRRMFTPRQFEAIGDENGFALKHVIYYHLHWLPPRFEGSFPRFFNAFSLAMQGIGETSAGAYIGSCFLAVLIKKD